MKRISTKNEGERDGAKQARLDINTQASAVTVQDTSGEQTRVILSRDEAAQLGAGRNGVRQLIRRSSGLHSQQSSEKTNGIQRRTAGRDSNLPLKGPGSNGIIHIHQQLRNIGPATTPKLTSEPLEFTALKSRPQPKSSQHTNNVVPSSALQQNHLIPASLLENSVLNTSKSTVKLSAIPKTSPVETTSGTKPPSVPKPYTAPYSRNVSQQILPVSNVTSSSASNSSATPAVNILNRAQTLFSVSSLKDSTSDLIQDPIVHQFPLYDSLYVGSPIPSPLFSDGVTSFPFTSTDYIIDQESVYLEQLLCRPRTSQENSFVTNRSENHCARTDIVQPFPFASPRLLNTVVDPLSVRSQQSSSSATNTVCQNIIGTNAEAKKKSGLSTIERLSSVVNGAARTSSSATATCSRLPSAETSENLLSGSSSESGSVGNIVTGSSFGCAIKSSRTGSSDFKPGSREGDLKPPPPGGIKRAGPYLLGKYYYFEKFGHRSLGCALYSKRMLQNDSQHGKAVEVPCVNTIKMVNTDFF